jgi:hypothetical protein
VHFRVEIGSLGLFVHDWTKQYMLFGAKAV